MHTQALVRFSLGLFAAASFSASGCQHQSNTELSPSLHPPQIQHIAVPAFFTDPQEWATLQAAGSVVSIVVPEYSYSQLTDPAAISAAQTLFQHSRNVGQAIFGYVSTQNGNRSRQAIDTDVANWYQRYSAQLNGIFLDEGPQYNDDARPFYEEVIKSIKNAHPGAKIVLNAAGYPHEWVMQDASYVVLWEQTAANYLDRNKYKAETSPITVINPPSWWTKPSYWNRIVHIVHHAIAVEQMKKVVRVSKSRAGHIYVFDGGSQGYNKLPSYWNEEVVCVSRGC